MTYTELSMASAGWGFELGTIAMDPLIAITTELNLARLYELRGYPSMATERRAIALDMMRAFTLPEKEVLLEN